MCAVRNGIDDFDIESSVSFLSIDQPGSRQLRISKVRGVQLAIVVDNKEGADNPGYRVKVQFPWLSEQDTSFWARIAVPMGGSGRGTYVLPEINDQVLVVFEHGDINRPIVIGALWSRKQEPVEVNQSGNNNTKLIKSRCGHRIIFDDKEGAEKIIVVDKTKKNKIVLDSSNKVVKIESDGDLEVIANTNVILHSNALKIGAKESIVGKGKSLLTHAQKTFGLKATSSISIGGGNTTINVSSSAATRVSGSGSGELGAPGAEAPRPQVKDKAAGVSAAPRATAPPPVVEPVAPAPMAPEPTTSEPKLVLARWSTDTAQPDDEVQVQIYTEAHPSGTPMKLLIKTRDDDEVVEAIDATVGGETTIVPWKYRQDTHGAPNGSGQPANRLPDYYCEATVAGETKTSGILAIRTTVTLTFKDKAEQPVRFARYAVKLVGGRTVEGETDDRGIALLKDVPPGSMQLRFLRSPMAAERSA